MIWNTDSGTYLNISSFPSNLSCPFVEKKRRPLRNWLLVRYGLKHERSHFAWLIDWLIDYRSVQPYFTRIETLPMPVKGCKIEAFCSAIMAFEQGGIFIVPLPAKTRDLGLHGPIRRAALFSRLLWQAKLGYWGFILTQISTGKFCSMARYVQYMVANNTSIKFLKSEQNSLIIKDNLVFHGRKCNKT